MKILGTLALASVATSIALATSAFNQDNEHQQQENTSQPASQPATQPTTQKVTKSDPYLLATCPVSGQKLGSMGDAIVKTYQGREVRFCCEGCIGEFESNQDQYFAAIDKKIVKAQLPHYPLDTCIVSGEALSDDAGHGEPINFVYKNRLVRVCCEMCVDKFKENPQKHLEELDKAVIAKQRAAYPMDVCLVSGQQLGSMGDPIERVYGNRLVRYCCAGCIKQFESNPTVLVAKLDEAWDAKRKESGDEQDAERPASQPDRR